MVQIIKLVCSLSCNAGGVTGLSFKSFSDNWSSAYQVTNDAGVPDPKGDVYWDFK